MAMFLTLHHVYQDLSEDDVLNWLNKFRVEYTDDLMLNRLVLTRKLNEYGYMDDVDSSYIVDINFDHFYLSSDQTLREYVSDFRGDMDHTDLVKASIHLNYNVTVDGVGKQIFDTFVKKNKANRVFDNKKEEVENYFADKRLLPEDKSKLLDIISMFEDKTNDFIGKIERERMFYERASSGKPARVVKTAGDWAEAIIEYEGLIAWFKTIIIPQISTSIDYEKINEFCNKQNGNSCVEPCISRSNLIGQQSCVYDKEEILERECNDKSLDNCASPCKKKISVFGRGGKCVYK
jgi:hypothetical protein